AADRAGPHRPRPRPGDEAVGKEDPQPVRRTAPEQSDVQDLAGVAALQHQMPHPGAGMVAADQTVAARDANAVDPTCARRRQRLCREQNEQEQRRAGAPSTPTLAPRNHASTPYNFGPCTTSEEAGVYGPVACCVTGPPASSSASPANDSGRTARPGR